MVLQPLAFFGLVICISTAEQTLLSGLSTAKARINEADASCISVAAELSPCLSAVRPDSKLTTMEEADCCTTLLVFKEANCYCLAPESVQELSEEDRLALGERISELEEANQRCGWEAVACSVPGVLDTQVMEERARPSTDGQTLEADMARFYGGRQGHEGLGARVASSSSQPASLPERGDEALVAGGRSGARSFGRATDGEVKRDALLDQMTTYMNEVIKLTEALSLEKGDDVDLTIEVTMGMSNFAGSSAEANAAHKAERGDSYPFWVFVVAFCLTMMAIALLLSTTKDCSPRRHPSASKHSPRGIVIAADEVHCLGKLVT